MQPSSVSGNPLELLASSSLRAAQSYGPGLNPLLHGRVPSGVLSRLPSRFEVRQPFGNVSTDRLFVSSVLQGDQDFSRTYDLLQRCCEELRKLKSQSVVAPIQIVNGRLPGKTAAFRSLAFVEEEVSPIPRNKRLAHQVSIEPLKLSEPATTKRPRSCTVVDDSILNSSFPSFPPLPTNETEVYLSRCHTPQTGVDHSISPRNLSRASSIIDMDHSKSPRQVKHGLGGERRLTINFLFTGLMSEPLQLFGKYRLIIRNGLSGTHTMYAQPWRFEITYEAPGSLKGEMRLRWKVVNLASSSTVSYLETAEQAHERQTKGNTICNLVVREALNKRACELEKELVTLELANSTRVANLRSLVRELRPKQCTEGLLFFGLRHAAAQSRAVQ